MYQNEQRGRRSNPGQPHPIPEISFHAVQPEAAADTERRLTKAFDILFDAIGDTHG
jgi:hypothetical protein